MNMLALERGRQFNLATSILHALVCMQGEGQGAERTSAAFASAHRRELLAHWRQLVLTWPGLATSAPVAPTPAHPSAPQQQPDARHRSAAHPIVAPSESPGPAAAAAAAAGAGGEAECAQDGKEAEAEGPRKKQRQVQLEEQGQRQQQGQQQGQQQEQQQQQQEQRPSTPASHIGPTSPLHDAHCLMVDTGTPALLECSKPTQQQQLQHKRSVSPGAASAQPCKRLCMTGHAKLVALPQQQVEQQQQQPQPQQPQSQPQQQPQPPQQQPPQRPPGQLLLPPPEPQQVKQQEGSDSKGQHSSESARTAVSPC